MQFALTVLKLICYRTHSYTLPSLSLYPPIDTVASASILVGWILLLCSLMFGHCNFAHSRLFAFLGDFICQVSCFEARMQLCMFYNRRHIRVITIELSRFAAGCCLRLWRKYKRQLAIDMGIGHDRWSTRFEVMRRPRNAVIKPIDLLWAQLWPPQEA